MTGKHMPVEVEVVVVEVVEVVEPVDVVVVDDWVVA
jgi:hypothetical protein